ncbi:Gfo/Idh/MocA family protein [Nonomuraea coxensis]|nr:Gfo/Idh/MocA family oxidoreductase [Nonomuraea coxensis]
MRTRNLPVLCALEHLCLIATECGICGVVSPLTRVGIVGAGNVAARHADVLSGFSDVTIAGIADTDLAKAEALASRHGSPAYGSHADLLSAGRLDAVYVCVPPFAHGNPELDVLSSDLPLFVEKPLSLDLRTAETIAAETDRRSLPSAVGHHWRYLDLVDRATELLAGRPVRLAIGHWLDKVPPVGWWLRRDLSGGQVVEQAVHVLDLARVLVGEVTMVHAVAAGDAPDGEVDRASTAVLRFAGGAAGMLATSCLLTRKHRAGLEVCADGIALELTETHLLVDGERMIEDDGRAKTRVDREFIDAVQGKDADVRATYREALRTHRLALALAESAAEGRPVTLDG